MLATASAQNGFQHRIVAERQVRSDQSHFVRWCRVDGVRTGPPLSGRADGSGQSPGPQRTDSTLTTPTTPCTGVTSVQPTEHETTNRIEGESRQPSPWVKNHHVVGGDKVQSDAAGF